MVDGFAHCLELLHQQVHDEAVAAQTSSYMGSLQAQLLAQLAGPLMLPAALRCIGYLRRMGGAYALTEAQLRVAFLRGRTAQLYP